MTEKLKLIAVVPGNKILSEKHRRDMREVLEITPSEVTDAIFQLKEC